MQLAEQSGRWRMQNIGSCWDRMESNMWLHVRRSDRTSQPTVGRKQVSRRGLHGSPTKFRINLYKSVLDNDAEGREILHVTNYVLW